MASLYPILYCRGQPASVISHEACADDQSPLDIAHSLQSCLLCRSDRLLVSEDPSNLLSSSIRNPNNHPLHYTIFISSLYAPIPRLPYHQHHIPCLLYFPGNSFLSMAISHYRSSQSAPQLENFAVLPPSHTNCQHNASTLPFPTFIYPMENCLSYPSYSCHGIPRVISYFIFLGRYSYPGAECL